MKNLIDIFYLLLLLCFGMTACSDWTETEVKDPANLLDPAKDAVYYENLRAWKKTDHQITFGWFGNRVGDGLSLEHTLRGLPDSVDLVSLWDGCWNPSEAKLADLRYVQEARGTRAMVCCIVKDMGDAITPEEVKPEEFWGENDSIRIVNYANALCDSIDKYNYDGFDYDYEPHYGYGGNITGNPRAEKIFVKTLARRLGPSSGTDKLLVIDGEPQSIPSELGPLFNYFIVQAYSCHGDADLDNRLNSTIDNFKGYLTPEEVAKRYIITENFESFAASGGVPFSDRYGNEMQSLEGMARYEYISNGMRLQKGGVGTYHMEYEYMLSGYRETYPYLRKAISIMNPQIR